MQQEFRIISERAAAERLNLSIRTLQGLRLTGRGPVFVQITDRRIGYSLDALQEWVRDRTRASTSGTGQAA